MKTAYITAVLISIATVESTDFAVSPLDGFEHYYLNMKRSSQLGVRFGKEKLNEKTDICVDILNSALLRTRYHCERALTLGDPDLHEELKSNYSDIFDLHYSRFGKYSPFKHLEFINRYAFYNVTIDDHTVVHEPAFSCLARKRASPDILQIFVSSIYDVNEDAGRHKIYDRIKARFVFTKNDRKQVVVIALAEEPSTVDEPKRSTEHVEMSFWNETYPDGRGSDDEICKLTRLQKIRLCNIILSSNEYRDRITFLSAFKNNVQPSCVLRELYFRHHEMNDSQWGYNSRHRVGPLDEWTISCEAVERAKNEPIVRFIIRGSGLKRQRGRDKYYVGAEGDEKKMYLESYHYRVSVVLTKETPQ